MCNSNHGKVYVCAYLLKSAPVTHLLEHHVPKHIRPFSPIITRDFRPPKPSPAGILNIARAWGVAITQDGVSAKQALPIVMVGDSVDDMTAGRDAGALTVLLRSPGKEELEEDERTDISVDRYESLLSLQWLL